ncbi:MCE family protein [Amycolatopsis sp. K13G38]|uniref:MCE family protein n=1 Tax=Amycolatopsis acididurans TaxID=2724524 RepID=A0ABX1J1D7_9PSEU|nr:MlaD family protein [Amycolatopsis acididurans]NKQ53216.1 MCE family protein [Amycolatopsis acididurans]
MAAARVHPRIARRFLVGIAAVVVAGGIVYYSTLANSTGGLPGSDHTYVQAVFGDVGTLQVNDEVRENSVRVGQISAIKVDNGRALVTMQLDGKVPVYGDAQASVWDQSALAVKFVELDPGKAGAGPLGDRPIPQEHTNNSVSLDQVFDVFDPPTRTGLQTAVQQLGLGTAGHGGDLNALLHVAPKLVPDAQEVAGTLASPQANLPALLASADRLAGRFQGQQDEITSLINQARDTFDAIDVDQAKPLTQTLHQLPQTLLDAQSAFDHLNQPLNDASAAMTTLRPGGIALGASADDLRGFLREAVTPLNKVPGVAGQAQPAVDALTTTFADARPVVPDLAEGLASARPLLTTLAPFTNDIQQFFASKSLLSNHVGDDHMLRIAVVLPYPESELAEVAPTLTRDPYPAPGQARQDKSGASMPLGLIGGGR